MSTMRSLKFPILCLLVVFIIPLMMNPLSGDGWFWEVGNGLGFIGLALLLIMTLNGRNKGGHSSIHRWLGFSCLFAIIAHGLWFVLGDDTVIEYIKFDAPFYMLLGVLALVLIIFLTLTSLLLFRKKAYRDRYIFLQWHNYLSHVILIISVLHTALSGYYFISVIQWLSMLSLVIFVYVVKDTSQPKVPKKSFAFLLLLAWVLLGVFVFIRNVIS